MKTSETPNSPSITGAEEIDRSLVGLCPSLQKAASGRVAEVSRLIEAYLFSIPRIERKIRKMTNQDTFEFLEGINIIVKENNIKNMRRLQFFLADVKSSINPTEICSPEVPSKRAVVFKIEKGNELDIPNEVEEIERPLIEEK